MSHAVTFPYLIALCPHLDVVPGEGPHIGAMIRDVRQFMEHAVPAAFEAIAKSPDAAGIRGVPVPKEVLPFVSCGIGLRLTEWPGHIIIQEDDDFGIFLEQRLALAPRSVHIDIGTRARYEVDGCEAPDGVTHMVMGVHISHTPTPFKLPATDKDLIVRLRRGTDLGALSKEAVQQEGFWKKYEIVARE